MYVPGIFPECIKYPHKKFPTLKKIVIKRQLDVQCYNKICFILLYLFSELQRTRV